MNEGVFAARRRLQKLHLQDLSCSERDKSSEVYREQIPGMLDEATRGNIDVLLNFSRCNGFFMSEHFEQESFVTSLCQMLQTEESMKYQLLFLITNLWFVCDDPNSILFSGPLVMSVIECAKCENRDIVNAAFLALGNFVLTSPKFIQYLIENNIIETLQDMFSQGISASHAGILSFCECILTQMDDMSPLYPLIPFILTYVSSQFPACRVPATRCVSLLCRSETGFQSLIDSGLVETATNAILLIVQKQIPDLLDILTLISKDYDILSDDLHTQVTKMLTTDDPSYLRNPLSRAKLCDFIARTRLSESPEIFPLILEQAEYAEADVRFAACSAIAELLLRMPDDKFIELASMGAIDRIRDVYLEAPEEYAVVMSQVMDRHEHMLY